MTCLRNYLPTITKLYGDYIDEVKDNCGLRNIYNNSMDILDTVDISFHNYYEPTMLLKYVQYHTAKSGNHRADLELGNRYKRTDCLTLDYVGKSHGVRTRSWDDTNDVDIVVGEYWNCTLDDINLEFKLGWEYSSYISIPVHTFIDMINNDELR